MNNKNKKIILTEKIEINIIKIQKKNKILENSKLLKILQIIGGD